MVKHFDIKVKEGQFLEASPDENNTDMAKEPPVSAMAKEAGLVGKTGSTKVEARIDLMNWSKRKDVTEAWKKLADREGVEHDAFKKAIWTILGFIFGRTLDLVISMSKAREFE
jgi:hypothetical protein